jgi:hypothetical protein
MPRGKNKAELLKGTQGREHETVRETSGKPELPRGWRFYFTIEGDTYVLHTITPHPK